MQGQRVVISIPCGGELKLERLRRSGCAAAPEPVPPLFVFDQVDRLLDQQILQIAKQRAGGHGAAVLLARADFPGRLEEPPLQRVKEAIAARFRLNEIGEDEIIDFLRHQLQTRHSDDEGRGIPPVIVRASAVGQVGRIPRPPMSALKAGNGSLGRSQSAM